ncbi:MAG: hypothetical protein NW217_07170 [Hyphomicrobiaceae bacterium]|nr:hypothetical protein [Hyphomicrobiaceae bacterium]
MPTLAIDGQLAWVILAIPLIALGFAVFRVIVLSLSGAERQSLRPVSTDVGQVASSAAREAAASAGPGRFERSSEAIGIELEQRAGGPREPAASTAPIVETVAVSGLAPAPVGRPGARDVNALIARAEAAGVRAELPALYLERALDLVGTGNRMSAAADLRRSITLATELGQRQVHARGRLELGDICQSEGDLTTACEHWHMARDLFLADKAVAEVESVKRRMEKSRCPTDWVLTEF